MSDTIYCYDYGKGGKRKTYYIIDNNGNKVRTTIKQLKSAKIDPSSIDKCPSIKNNTISKYFSKDSSDKYSDTSDEPIVANESSTPKKKLKPKIHTSVKINAKKIDIHKEDDDYIKFQKSINLPFETFNGLNIIDKSPDDEFKKYLDDIISLIGTVRLADIMASSDAYYSDLEKFLTKIVGYSPRICRGYRNYYGYSRNDINLFSEDIIKSFGAQDLDLYYLPCVPTQFNINKLEDVNNRKYINLDTIGELDVLASNNIKGVNDIKKCIENKSNYDYMLLTLRYHIEPTTFSEKVHKFPKLLTHDDNYIILKEGRIHTAMLLINLNDKNPDDKNTGYFLDIFGDSDVNKVYTMSAFIDLSSTNKLPLFFSVYNGNNVPNFVIQDNTSFRNIWNWFLLSLEILNPDIGRVEILTQLLNMNKINRLRLIYQYMYYIFQSYGKVSAVKYMMEGIENGPVRGVNSDYINEVWKNTYKN